jgi:hypothetical protein
VAATLTRAGGRRRMRAPMRLSVEFPSVAYREGPEAVRRFARTLEEIGYDHVDVFDHVQAGARSVDAMLDSLARLHGRLRAEVG